jgi:hypothetical protein
MTSPRWTVAEARAKRAKDGARRERLHHFIARPLGNPMRLALKAASGLFGPVAYHPAMHRAGSRMNANTNTAFQGAELSAQDIICSAYFKAGTNWVMHICYQIAQLGEGRFEHVQDVIAWPDAAEPRYWRALEDRDSAPSPTGFRVIKSHLPADLVPLESAAKFIAVTRDPLDCAASGYHFFAKLFFGAMTPPPDAWLEFFGSDAAIAGPWHRFTATWWAARKRPNVLFLRFEDIKASPRTAISEIASHLGTDLTPEQLECIAEATSFESMTAINHKFYPVRQTIWSTKGGKIIRQGVVGEGDKLFSPEATARFQDKMAQGLKAAGCNQPFYGLGRAEKKDRA